MVRSVQHRGTPLSEILRYAQDDRGELGAVVVLLSAGTAEYGSFDNKYNDKQWTIHSIER